MRQLSRSVAGFLAVISASLPASAIEMRPGLWALSTTIDRNGAVATRPSRTICVTAQKAAAARINRLADAVEVLKGKLDARLVGRNCQMFGAKSDAEATRWSLRCAGSSIVEQESRLKFESPDHFVLTIRTSGVVRDAPFAIVATTEGRRDGACPQ